MRYYFVLSLFLLLAISASQIYSRPYDKIPRIENQGKGLWGNSKRLNFEYQDQLKVDEKKGIFLASVSDIKTDSMGNIFVCDKTDHCVQVFDYTGKFKYRIGKQGRGPGELLNPEKMFITHSKIYISDSNHRINVFDPGGTFIGDYSAKNFMISDLCVSLSNQFLFCTAVAPMYHFADKIALPGMHILNLANKQWFEAGELSYLGRTRNGYQTVTTSMVTTLATGDILYASGYPYELKIYTEAGALKTIITRKYKTIAEPKIFEIAPGIEILIPRTDIRKIFALSDGNFMIALVDLGKDFLKLFEKSPDHSPRDISLYYDLYNTRGELLQSFPVDSQLEIGVIMHCDPKNYVYTYNPEWEAQTVKKYLISFVDKNK